MGQEGGERINFNNDWTCTYTLRRKNGGSLSANRSHGGTALFHSLLKRLGLMQLEQLM